MHSFIFIHRGPSSVFFIAYLLNEEPPWGASPRFKPGTALQQSDALLTELRRTLTEHNLLSTLANTWNGVHSVFQWL